MRGGRSGRGSGSRGERRRVRKRSVRGLECAGGKVRVYCFGDEGGKVRKGKKACVIGKFSF